MILQQNEYVQPAYQQHNVVMGHILVSACQLCTCNLHVALTINDARYVVALVHSKQ